MQYDNPFSAGDVKDALTANTSISATTANAISQILDLDNAETVAIGSWNGVDSVVAPTGTNAHAIFADIAGAAGTTVTVDLTSPDLSDAQAFVFASDANLALDFTASSADNAERVIVSGNGNDNIIVGNGNTTVDTGAGNDTVTLGNGDNMVIANSGDNQISTGTGRDTIFTGTGNDTVDAGAGYDVAHVAGSRADFAANVSGNSLNLNGGDHAINTSNVEFISFDNNESIVVASTDEEAAALRLYNGLLGRDADAGGAEAWANAANGTALTDIAQGFLNSSEFQNNMNSDFIQSVYSTLLGRDADAGGEEAWLNLLANGASRADVIAGLTNSDEGKAAMASADDTDYVKALYTSVLGREADDAGLENWVAVLSAGADRASVAQSISGSSESTAKSTSDFIDGLYNNALGRDADAEGKAAWTNALEHGATEAEVAIGIVGSDEGIDSNGNVVVVHGVA
ncbi:DUF4214 domain-containing protein [Pseudomonas sp. NPDC087336]|uniref:DUF4214 domain-containing protein n=1 Tax=Pseudomonas sp. NPDC087336 TaxID=3364436 RepID=UPI0038305DC2